MIPRALLPSLACLALLATAPAVQASVAHVDDGVAQAHGEPGEANDMTIRSGGDGVIFTDSAGIRPRDEFGCRALSRTEVTCVGDGGMLWGEDGDDTLRDVGLAPGSGLGARGGPGNDTIVAGAVDAIIYGDDRELLPTDGDDTIVGSSSTRELRADVPDFHDEINGGGGNDTIDAREGNDNASGQAGTDSVQGGDGDDNIESTSLLTPDGGDAHADEGNDTLLGGAGDDVLRAGRGKDSADGGDGNDRVDAINSDLGADDGSSDSVRCGAGSDSVAAGASDKLQVGCEILRVAIYCPGGGGSCSAKGGVTGKAKGARKPTTVAKVNRTVSSGNYVDLAFGKKATRLLGSGKKVKLSVRITTRGKFTGGVGFDFSFVK